MLPGMPLVQVCYGLMLAKFKLGLVLLVLHMLTFNWCCLLLEDCTSCATSPSTSNLMQFCACTSMCVCATEASTRLHQHLFVPVALALVTWRSFVLAQTFFFTADHLFVLICA